MADELSDKVEDLDVSKESEETSANDVAGKVEDKIVNKENEDKIVSKDNEDKIVSKDNEDKIVNKDNEDSPSDDVNEEGKNMKEIKCQNCPSTILLAGVAKFVTHEFYLPDGKDKPKDAGPSKYWVVDDMYAFENVGFSFNHEGVKYLTCADCEIGPIGWHDLKTNLSYVSTRKINYC